MLSPPKNTEGREQNSRVTTLIHLCLTASRSYQVRTGNDLSKLCRCNGRYRRSLTQTDSVRGSGTMFGNFFFSLSQHTKNDEGILCKRINCVLFLVNAFIKHIISYTYGKCQHLKPQWFISLIGGRGETQSPDFYLKAFFALRKLSAAEKVIWKLTPSFFKQSKVEAVLNIWFTLDGSRFFLYNKKRGEW